MERNVRNDSVIKVAVKLFLRSAPADGFDLIHRTSRHWATQHCIVDTPFSQAMLSKCIDCMDLCSCRIPLFDLRLVYTCQRLTSPSRSSC